MILPSDLPVQILHTHSTMSVLDGASPISEYLKYAAKEKLPAVAITDHGWLSGAFDLIDGCRKWGDPNWCKSKGVEPAAIKPIPGIEPYLKPLDDHKFAGKPYDYFHLTIWAVTMRGYQNLISLASHSWDFGKPVVKWGRAKPRITFQDLEQFNEGLVIGSGCIEGPIGKCLRHGEVEQAIIYADRLHNIFGPRLFFEIFPGVVDRDYVKEAIVQVTGVNGVTYAFKSDDILDTDQGSMAASEALAAKPAEIFNCTPVRVQDGPIADVDRIIVGNLPQYGEILMPEPREIHASSN